MAGRGEQDATGNITTEIKSGKSWPAIPMKASALKERQNGLETVLFILEVKRSAWLCLSKALLLGRNKIALTPQRLKTVLVSQHL
jgi:hypothetical protein